eukprot:jgi/Chlat1/391/Chrsp10S01527
MAAAAAAAASALPSVILHGGGAMPAVGLGTWKIDKKEDLFVTSKLWNTFHAKEHVREACEKSLADLKLEYLDLYLIHFPISLKYVPIEVYSAYIHICMHFTIHTSPSSAMESLVSSGLTRRIGVANFSASLLMDLLKYSTINPCLNQIELHPYLQQRSLVEWCNKQGVACTGFSPLGAGSYYELGYKGDSVLDDPVITNIAQRLNKTPAQVVLRWGVQRGTAVIPKSQRLERIKENLELDFQLSGEDIDAINSLDKHKRYNDPGKACVLLLLCYMLDS